MLTRKGLAALVLCGLAAIALAVAACDGTAEAPTTDELDGETTDADSGGEDGSGFTLTAGDFGDGDTIPTRYTCDGDDTSPALMWSGAPEGTSAFALIVDDPDASTERPFVHFVVYDLPGGGTGLEGGIPVPAHPDAGGYQGRNDFGRTGWGGPCPPDGETHDYVFALYALSEELGLDPGATKDEVLAAAEGRILATAEMVATYGR